MVSKAARGYSAMALLVAKGPWVVFVAPVLGVVVVLLVLATVVRRWP